MKVRKLALVVAAACTWSAAAFAIVQEGTTTLTEGGKPIGEATVKVTINQPVKTSTSQVRRPTQVVHRVKTRTDTTGRVTIKYDDQIVDRSEATVDLEIITNDGRVLRRRGIPLSYFGSGMPIDVAMPASPYVPVAGTPYPYVPGTPFNWSGVYIGGQGSGIFNQQNTVERWAMTNVVSNRLNDFQNMGSIGILGGYDFWYPGGGVTLGPFASWNWVGQSNNHDFASGFIGTRTNWFADVGGKLAVPVSPYASIYARGGVEFKNYDFNIDFGGPKTSLNRTATGWMAGFGAEVTQQDWRFWDGQVMAFGEIEYARFDRETFRMPVSSPLFNYGICSDEFRFMAGIVWRAYLSKDPRPRSYYSPL